ncbi:hypothetical protein MN608_00935 [Microdochium nivale]|nr:hypothetical protein MN608_00935 [Microdochium nivale]
MAGSNKTSSHSSSKKSHHASSSSGTMRPESTRSHGEAGSSSSRAQHHGHRHHQDNQAAIDRYMQHYDRIEHFLNRNEDYPLRGSTSRQEDSQRTIRYFDGDWAHASNNSQSHSNGDGHHGNNDSHRHSNSGHSDDPHHRSSGSGSGSGSNSRHHNPYAEPYYYPDASGEPRSQRGSGQNHKSHSGDKDHHKGGRYHR